MRPKKAIRKYEAISERMMQQGLEVSDFETHQVIDFEISIESRSFNVRINEDQDGIVTVDLSDIEDRSIKCQILGVSDDKVMPIRKEAEKSEIEIQEPRTVGFTYPMRDNFAVKIWLPADGI